LLEIILEGVFAPFILFFVLGLLSVFVKSDLAIPPALTVGMSLFLLMAIGLGGGRQAVEALMVDPALLGVVVAVAIFSIICGIFFAFSTANILKRFAKLRTADAWATGGHYGAVSSVTLAVGVGIASAAQEAAPLDLIFVGWMAAMYPFMDSPAILTAIVFGRTAIEKEELGERVKINIKEILHHSIFGMAVWVLVCSLIIGMVAQVFSPDELDKTMHFFDGMFRGVLSLFLLNMGMAAGKQIGALKALGRNIFRVIVVAYMVPLLWGLIGISGVYAVHLLMPGHLGWGDAFVFATIAGGCSYISAPAAMYASIPEANPSIYLPMSLGLTFPFNITLNIPIWMIICRALWGA
jgi:hypothetical protein